MTSWAWALPVRPRREPAPHPAACSRRTSFLAGGCLGGCPRVDCPHARGRATLLLRSDLREYSVELVERGVFNLEPPSDGGLGDDATAGAQPALQALRKIPDPRRIRCSIGRTLLPWLLGQAPDQGLGRPDRQPLSDGPLRRLPDRLDVIEAQQGAGMAHVQLPTADGFPDLLGQLEEPERVRDGRALLSDALRDLLLSEPVVGEEDVVRLRLLDRVQVGALDVLDEG